MSFLKICKALFSSAPRLAPLDCAHRVRSGEAVLIDVREPGEWTSGVAERAVLLPLSDLTGRRTQWQPFLAANADKELLVYCASGGRSAIAARLLTNDGHRAANTGGLGEWTNAGWPVTRPKPTRR
ncbi:MAG: rhodanese-like domain-containing protein [Verrucomicrobia bacterium]|nr:rhodanese-like domain-containing protein [Verrucomicrobiota bacterium]